MIKIHKKTVVINVLSVRITFSGASALEPRYIINKYRITPNMTRGIVSIKSLPDPSIASGRSFKSEGGMALEI